MKEDRDILFSNFKGLLITLVVLGHVSLIARPIVQTQPFQILKIALLAVRMPAFMFISGYFSKSLEKGRNNAIKNLLIPFVLMNLYDGIVRMIFSGKFTMSFALPDFATWFLFAIFVYKLILPELSEMRKPLVILCAVVGSALIDIYPYVNVFTLGRLVGFLPFFLFGYYVTSEDLQKLKKLSHWYFIPAFIIYIYGIYEFYITKKVGVMVCRYTYASLKLSNSDGIKLHMLFMAMSLCAILLLIKYLYSKRCFFTQIGDNSFSVYFFHAGIVLALTNFNFLAMSGVKCWIAFILFSVFLAFVLSRDCVAKLFKQMVGTVNSLLFSR